MTVKVLIGPGIGGLLLKPSVVNELFERFPALFDEPFPLEDFAHAGAPGTGGDAEDGLLTYSHSCVRGDQIYFLKDGPELRAHPWLIAQIEQKGSAAICRKDYNGKVIEIPSDVRWYVYADDDGSESIHEVHRTWR